jgi:hypothetical protein
MNSNSNISLALRTSASLTFWERLRELGLSEVHIHYEGFYGGGESTEITGVDQKGCDVLPPEIEVLIGSTLVRDLTDLACELLHMRVPNWSEGVRVNGRPDFVCGRKEDSILSYDQNICNS